MYLLIIKNILYIYTNIKYTYIFAIWTILNVQMNGINYIHNVV